MITSTVTVQVSNFNPLTILEDVYNSVAIFLNAIYFKGKWRKPFDASKTVNDTFNSVNGPVRVEYLSDIDQYYYFYSKDLNAEIVRIPYAQSKFSMFIILPKDNLDNLVKKLDNAVIHRDTWNLEELEVDLKLPKFQYKSGTNLQRPLETVNFKRVERGLMKKLIN